MAPIPLVTQPSIRLIYHLFTLLPTFTMVKFSPASVASATSSSSLQSVSLGSGLYTPTISFPTSNAKPLLKKATLHAAISPVFVVHQIVILVLWPSRWRR